MTSITDQTALTMDGGRQPMSDYAGKVLLIVNTASECGFTSQYEGLEALHRDYRARGFSVLVFPCNQFGGQEPGTDAEIAAFCANRFSVSFPMFAKIDVNGPDADPLWSALKAARPGLLGSEAIKWNFTKFLVGRDGAVVARYAPTTKPDAIRDDIERLLG